MTLGAKLKSLREKSGESQNKLAKKIGVSRQAISHWENDHNYPDLDKLSELSEIFKINIDELLNLEKNPTVKQDRSTLAEKNNEKRQAINEKEFPIPKYTLGKKKAPLSHRSGILLTIIIFCFFLAPIGLIGVPIILWYNRKNYTYHRSILFASFLTLIYNIVIIISIISDIFDWGIITTH